MPFQKDKNTQLLIDAQDEDTEAFDHLFNNLYQVVWDFTIKLNSALGHHDRDDVVQETFIRTWRQKNNFRGASSATTYVFSIAKNVLRQKVFEQKKLRKLYSQDVDEFADYAAPQYLMQNMINFKERLEAVEFAKGRLSEKQLEAFELTLPEGLSVAEAAKLTNCSYKAFRRRLDLAKGKIRKIIQNNNYKESAAIFRREKKKH